MISDVKMAMLLEDDSDAILDSKFSWETNPDGTWSFSNGVHTSHGYFIKTYYSGAYNGVGDDHLLHMGDIVGVKNEKCWRIKSGKLLDQFSCIGLAMGWYEGSDSTLVQISGIIKNIGSNWIPGNKVYIPSTYGIPIQLKNTWKMSIISIGVALNQTDLLITNTSLDV